MTVIGIDLGTTHSEVAWLRDGVPAVVTIDGSPLVPSAISLGPDGTLLIGQAALNNELAAPADTVRWIKRRMGSDATIALGGRSYSPAMISAMILRHLARAAAQAIGAPVTGAVVTVPAFFSERAREDTREAARLAGLNLLRLVNEPTAAAAAYIMGARRDERWLVYDLGGGTFDVSIVDSAEGVLAVRASHGDTALGGHDFDRQIAQRAAAAFQAAHGIDLSADRRAWARLLRAAEAAKIRLSVEAVAVLREEHIARAEGVDLHLEFTLRRTEYEALIAPAIERTLASVRIALAEAQCGPESISRVLLVGGATRTPLVGQRLRAEFGIEPQTWINPDTVVAQGAAVEAASLAGEHVGSVMVDVTPHSLGVGAVTPEGFRNIHLVHRNSPLPCVASRILFKQDDEQDQIDIEIFQGESTDPNRALPVGRFTLDRLGHSETSEVHCRFELDRSGLLRVVVADLGSGTAIERTIDRPDAARRGDPADLAAMISAGPGSIAIDEAEDAWAANRPQPTERAGDGGPESAPPAAPASGSLVDQAEKMLAKPTLNDADRADLVQHLAAARAGDPQAVDRLRDLIYFLE